MVPLAWFVLLFSGCHWIFSYQEKQGPSASDGAQPEAGCELGGTDCRAFSAQELGEELDARAQQSGYQLVLGGFFACAYRNNGYELKCFGENDRGQLGLETTGNANRCIGDEPGEMGAGLTEVALPAGGRVVALAAGVKHVCAVLQNKKTYCWGGNDSGELGVGHTEAIGDETGEMGDSLVPVRLDDPNEARYAVALAVSGYSRTGSTCALLDNGKIKCWGQNNLGQLGQGNNKNNNATDLLPYTELPSGRVAIAISGGRKEHFCALLDDRSVVCWGNNTQGQLGSGHSGGAWAAVGDELGEMGDHLVPVDLGDTAPVISISGAKCALFDDGRVKCWGANLIENNTDRGGGLCAGVLGIGTTQDHGDDPDEMGNNLPFVDFGAERRMIALAPAIGNIMCAIEENRLLRCWGKNNWNGGLGTGTGKGAWQDKSGPSGDPVQDGYYTPDCRGDAPDEVGDNLPTVDLGAGRTVLAADVGFDGGCALLDTLELKCWGANHCGCLGLELTPADDVTARFDSNNGKGDEPGEMGDALPVVSLGY